MASKVLLLFIFTCLVQLNEQTSEGYKFFFEISSKTRFLPPFNVSKRTSKPSPEEIYAKADEMCKLTGKIQSKKNEYINSYKTAAMGTVRGFYTLVSFQLMITPSLGCCFDCGWVISYSSNTYSPNIRSIYELYGSCI